MDGTIIDIRRFTLHDGPGLRSTVFLKGCGLRCAWCHNPEGIENRLDLWYLRQQCIHCNTCLGACPEGALSLAPDGDHSIIIDRQRCTRCGLCSGACPTNALSFDGQRLSSGEVVRILLQDRQFYSESGGGITISGGDPLVQHDFALEILRRCKAAGIHTAIETGLHGAWSVLERFIPVTDLFIVDLKLADSRIHQKYTGKGNELIKGNYQRLAARKGAAPYSFDLLTRIPLIPGITDLPDNLAAIATFVRDCNAGGSFELINFNPLAGNKYLLMDRDRDFFRSMVPLGEDALAALRAIFELEGLTAVQEHKQ